MDEHKLRKALKMKPKKAALSIWPIVMAPVLAGVCALVLLAPEIVEEWADQIGERVIGRIVLGPSRATAEGKANSSQPEGQEKAKPSSTDALKASANQAGGPLEEPSYFKVLRERKQELDAREKELLKLEEELQKQRVELDGRIAKLEELRREIASVLKDRVEVDQERVGQLVDFYSNMKPKQAADVLAKIEEDLAVEIIGRMKKKTAGDIMGLLEPDKAKVISERLAGYRR